MQVDYKVFVQEKDQCVLGSIDGDCAHFTLIYISIMYGCVGMHAVGYVVTAGKSSALTKKRSKAEATHETTNL